MSCALEERQLDLDEKPLVVQLNWNKDDREGRFVLKNENDILPKVSCSASCRTSQLFSIFLFTQKMKRDAFVWVCSLNWFIFIWDAHVDSQNEQLFYCNVFHLYCFVHQQAMMNHVLHRQNWTPKFNAFVGLTKMANCVIWGHLQANKQDVCQDCWRVAFKLEAKTFAHVGGKIKVAPLYKSWL